MIYKNILQKNSLTLSLAISAIGLFGCNPDANQYVAPQPTASTPPAQNNCIPSSPTPTPSPSSTACSGPFCGGGVLGEVRQAATAKVTACPTGSAAVLSFDGSITNFGLQSIGSHIDRTLTVINLGQTTATSINANLVQGTFNFTGGSYPGTGGTCGVELASNQTCTLVMDFYPQGLNEFTSPLNVNYFDGQNNQTLSTTLSGIGVAYPTLSFASPTLSFGSILLGNESSQTVTVQYAGTYPATGISVQALSNGFSFLGGSYPGTGGTCGAQISANCTIVLSATPTQASVSSFTLNMDYDNGAFAASASLGLSDIGTNVPTAAVLQISPPIADPNGNFGNVTFGSQISSLFTVVKSGTLPATNVSAKSFSTSSFFYTGGSYPGTGGTCSNQITGSCLIALTFDPSKQGTINDTMGLTYLNGVSNQNQTTNEAVQGTGVVAANLVWSTAGTFDFGNVSINATRSQALTLTNTSLTLSANGIQFSGMTSNFSIASTTCGSSLAPNTSCTVNVWFTPTQAESYQTQISALYSNGFNSTVSNQSIIGQGTDAALLVFEPASTNFGSVVVGSSLTQNFTVKYYGSLPASDIQWSAMSGPDYYYAGGTCSTVIDADCTVAIQYLPQTPGAVTTPIVLLYNNGYLGQTALLNAAANGITPANLSFSVGNSYDFAAISVNGQATTVITVANSGQATASGLAFSGLSSPFSIVQNGCGATLSGGATCSLTVEFAPTAANNFSENLQLSYGNGLITTGVSTQLTGSGSANPTLGLGGGNGGGNEGSGGSSGTSENYNFGNVFVGGNATASFTLNYTGLNAASIVSVTSLNGPDFFFDSGSSFPGSGTCGANQITTTCTFGLMFKPSKTGLLSASFSLVYNDGVSQKTLQINLSGHGIQPAVLTASPASQVFASTPLNYTRALMFSVTNSSSSQSSANLSSLSSISSPFTYAGGTCFGVNGNSPMKLAPNASCTVIVSFEPAAANTFNQSISLAYNDGAQAQVLSLGTSGTGTSAAVLVLEQGTSYNFGSVVEEKTATAQISVQYYGANTASVQSMQVSAPFTITGGTCTNSITQSCTIGVSFTPTAAASSSSALTVTYADGTGATQTASVTLSGTGVSPALLSTPPTLSFNPVLVSTSESLNLTISNSGSTAASNIQFSGLTEPFSITTNTCTGSVSSTCKIGVNFTSSTSGSFSQTLQIAYFDGEANQSISVAVSSSSQTAPQLTSTPQGLGSFAAIALGSQTSLTYLIANTGSDNASSMTLQNPSAQVGFTISQNTCGSALAIGQSCLITVLFNPSTPGTSSDRFILSYMGSTSGSFTLSQALSAQSSVPVQLATKGNHTCVINHSGQVECWGESDYGQTGPAQKQAISLGTGHYATAVATGFFHTCAILENGMLKCWGRNDSGQLGLGDSLNRGLSANDLGDNLPAVNLGTGRTAKAISLGYSHTCAILDNGTVKCWGQNLQGQLGQGDTLTRGLLATDMGDHLAPVSLGTGLTALSISSNVGHNCVLLSNQSMKCWGDNFYGELGLGDSVNRGSLPNQMGDNLPAVALPTGPTGMIPAQVNTGGGFTCVNSTLGQVSCWGFNYHGTLGTCWALNSQGQLGSCFNVGYTNYIQGYGLSAGEMGNALPAVDLGLSELSIPVQAVASGTSFTCVTYSNGSGLKCFGDNTQGQLGQGDLTNAGDQPNEMGSNLQSVNLGTNIAIRNIVAGSFHACAVFQDDSVRCWGANAQGQLGMSLSNPNWGASANQMGSDLPVVSF